MNLLTVAFQGPTSATHAESTLLDMTTSKQVVVCCLMKRKCAAGMGNLIQPKCTFLPDVTHNLYPTEGL